MSILRCDSRVSRPRVPLAALAVRNVPSSVTRIGRRAARPDTSRLMVGEGLKPPVRITPARFGKPSAWCASSRPSSTSLRSPGVMTTAPGWSRSSRCSTLIAPTSTSRTSRESSVSSPPMSVAPTASASSRSVGANSSESSGIAQTGTCPQAMWDRIASSSVAAARLTTHATTCAWFAAISVCAISATSRIWSGVRFRPLTTSTVGAPRLAAIRALYASSVGPATSV